MKIIFLLRRRIFFCSLTVISACLQAAAADNNSNSGGYALKGTLVTPTEIVEDGAILVVGDKIQAMGKDIPLPNGTKVIETKALIYPGLIDLHDHITWNFLPRWKPGQKFANRYEWQQIPEYSLALRTPHDQVVSNPSPSPTRPPAQEELACDANRYGEVKAIVGGATSVVDSLGDPKVDPCIKGLARNLNSYSGMYPAGKEEELRNAVFPLELTNDDVKKINDNLADPQQHYALVVHLAEGKSNDASAAREFRMFRARGFVRAGVSIIHGVALRQPEFVEMAKAQVGLIWSPRSNIELYGETTDVRAAKQSQVKIALAPDWSPSGSDGTLEELNYAAVWNAGQNPRVFTDAELVEMVTVNPAKLARLDDKVGSLKPGYFADLLVVGSQQTDPYRALLNARPTDIRLVVVGGRPMYGDEDLMQGVAPNARLEPVSLCGTKKFLDLETENPLPGKPPRSWKDTVDAITKALKPSGLAPSELTSCP
ncbi:MAG TPA: amidohydrolase family protein [Chthoniobacterales bacterium]|nr:amidohydrolase family protein [Chthoniobacterales bacterium]